MLHRVFPVAFAAGLFALSGVARADAPAAVCSVAVDYLHGATLANAYRRDFVVEEGVTFVDDQSTALRSKRFTATHSRSGGETLVTIDYFADVGVFVAVGFATSVTIRGGGTESNAGSHTTSIPTGSVPGAIGGNHTTKHSLACRRL